MKEWQATPLRNLGRIITGKTPPEARPDSWGEGVPFLTPSDFDGGRIVEHYGRRLSATGQQLMGRITIPHGVAVSCIGWQMGKAVWVREPTVTNQQINSIIHDPLKVDGLFLYYNMKNRRDEIFRLGSGGSRTPILKKTLFENLDVLLPPLEEQRAIARILGALDDKIELNRRMNRTLETMAQALFRSWFVDFEPVSAKREGRKPIGMDAATAALFPEHFQESAMGPIPAGWKHGSTADIARYVNGKNFTKNPTGTGRMVIRIAELNSGPAGSTVYNDIPADPENTAYPGDLLFAWSGSLDVYRWHRDEALVNQHIFKVICEEYPQWFTHFHLQESMTFFQGVAADKATTMGHIKREHLSQPDVALPPPELIAAANRIIQPLYERMHKSERQNISLAAQRDTLLPQLLSGELRIEQAEKVLP